MARQNGSQAENITAIHKAELHRPDAENHNAENSIPGAATHMYLAAGIAEELEEQCNRGQQDSEEDRAIL